jgi:hypothetical protein
VIPTLFATYESEKRSLRTQKRVLAKAREKRGIALLRAVAGLALLSGRLVFV